MNGKFMRPIVPPGYAVPKQELQRLTGELRKSRADELARASEKDRTRIEKEISREVQRKIAKPDRLGGFVWHFGR
jgi:hypothetical protein